MRAYFQHLERVGGMTAQESQRVRNAINRAEQFQGGPQHRAAVANLEATAKQLRDPDQQALADAMLDLAAALG